MRVSERCRACVFFEKFEHDHNGDGRCRRFAPAGERQRQPVVNYMDWCGEFRAPEPREDSHDER